MRIYSILKDDFDAYCRRRGGGLRGSIYVILFSHSFWFNFWLRISASLWSGGAVAKTLARLIRLRMMRKYGCDIDLNATFGFRTYFPHPNGIVIGGEWDIGDDVTILHQVTLGRTRPPEGRATLSRGVFVGAGAKIIGHLSVGEFSNVGANAVVTRDVPDNHTAVGVPARNFSSRSAVGGLDTKG